MNRVLIIDNNIKVANYLKDLLKEKGYKCVVCDSGIATLLELGRTVIDEEVPLYNLLVVDLGGLGDMIGSDLVSKIRGKDEEMMKRDVYMYLYPIFRDKAEETYSLIHKHYFFIPVIGISKRPERKDWCKYGVYRVIQVNEETNTVDKDALFDAINELFT